MSPESKQPNPSQIPLSNIEPIPLSEGQPLATLEDIHRLVEPPAIDAVTDLWDKNIGTVSSSANPENGVYIDVDWQSLSDENQAIARENGLVDDSEETPNILKIAVPVDDASTEESTSEALLSVASIFTPQELKWAKAYSVEEMKEIYGFGKDEELDPSEIDEFYFAPDGRFHLSEALYEKSLFKVEAPDSSGHEAGQPTEEQLGGTALSTEIAVSSETKQD